MGNEEDNKTTASNPEEPSSEDKVPQNKPEAESKEEVPKKKEEEEAKVEEAKTNEDVNNDEKVMEEKGVEEENGEKDKEETEDPKDTESNDEPKSTEANEKEDAKEEDEAVKKEETEKNEKDEVVGTDEKQDSTEDVKEEADKKEILKTKEDEVNDKEKETPNEQDPETEEEAEEEEKVIETKAEDKENGESPKQEENDNEGDDNGNDDEKKTETPRKRGRKKKTLGLDTADFTPLSTGKRTRKTANRLSPELGGDASTPNGSSTSKKFEVSTGRGVALESIELVKAKIKATKKDNPVLKEAHALVFSIRGRPKVNLIKSHLLQFSGYLPPLKTGAKKRDEHEDEEIETKASIKAFKLTVAQLKNLITLFDVHTEASDKETLIDNLLDFLGAPDAKLTKGFMKKKNPKSPITTTKKRKASGEEKSSSKKKKLKKAEENVIEDEDDYEDYDDEGMDVEIHTPTTNDGKKMPSDSKLRKWVKAYVGCFNLDKATTKHAIETASDKFGVNMSSKKAKIKMLLADELS